MVLMVQHTNYDFSILMSSDLLHKGLLKNVYELCIILGTSMMSSSSSFIYTASVSMNYSRP